MVTNIFLFYFSQDFTFKMYMAYIYFCCRKSMIIASNLTFFLPKHNSF